MLNREQMEKEIRERWFKDHVATLTTHGELQVLRWKKPGTGIYGCSYVFDGNHMYISGDIGWAVFCLTWKASIHSFDVNIHYFDEKLSASSEERRDFNAEKAKSRLREWLKDLKEGDRKYDHDDMKKLFEQARGCDRHSEWAEIVNSNIDFISGLDCDYWEWIYSIGDEIPTRVYGWLIGLKMASEQLKNKGLEAS